MRSIPNKGLIVGIVNGLAFGGDDFKNAPVKNTMLDFKGYVERMGII